MLVISSKREAEIFIGSDITIKVLEIRKGQIKLGIEAPRGCSICRGEHLTARGRSQPRLEKEPCRNRRT